MEAKNSLFSPNAKVQVVQNPHDQEDLENRFQSLENMLRKLKSEGKVLETDAEALQLSRQLQDVCRQLLKNSPHSLLTMVLEFPEVMLKHGEPKLREIRLRTAPLELMPYAVYKFLRIVNHWQGGSFHRNAGHVLQAQVSHSRESLAFQEYHAQFPHKRYTLGFAGRPGGPAFYISTIDNTRNHGPASQGSASEADSCFAEVEESSHDIVNFMQEQPGADHNYGFIDDDTNWIIIHNFTVS